MKKTLTVSTTAIRKARNSGLPTTGCGKVLSISESNLKLVLALGISQPSLEVLALCSRPRATDARGNTIYVWDAESSRLFDGVSQAVGGCLEEEDDGLLHPISISSKQSQKNDCLDVGFWDVPDPYRWVDVVMIVSSLGEILHCKNFYQPTDYAIPPDGRKHTVWTFI